MRNKSNKISASSTAITPSTGAALSPIEIYHLGLHIISNHIVIVDIL